MDKNKVIELIKKGISYWNRSSYITSTAESYVEKSTGDQNWRNNYGMGSS